MIDDEPHIVALVTAVLEAEGYAVESATNGVEAIAKARQSRPDAVVGDAVMPGMDGFAVVRALRADPLLNGLRVILTMATDACSPFPQFPA